MNRKNNKKVYLMGKDGMGWALDKDIYYHSKALKDIGITIVSNIIKADIIITVWWGDYLLLSWKFKLIKKLFNKTVIATVTNDLNHRKDYFSKVKNIIDVWVCLNSNQKKFLLYNGINENKIFLNPSYIDEMIFKRLNLQKKEIAELLNIDLNLIENKFLIGSFQRDSLGVDLSKPKWQKNPDLLIEILQKLDKNRFILILAGPRRHYVINKCIEFGIPYVFVGDEEMIIKRKDDIQINTLPLGKVNLLYNLIDLCIVSSKSEGQPKAITETSLSKTPILSTDVGIAEDVLDEYCICRGKEDFLKKIEYLSENDIKSNEIIEKNYTKVSKLNNYEAYKKRIKKIIECQ